MRAGDFFDQVGEGFPVSAEVAAEVDPPFVLAGNVYRLRAARGLSQAELAARLGVSQPRIAEIERGDANPRLATLSRLAHALGVRPSDLLDPDFECSEPDAVGAAPAGLEAGTSAADRRRLRAG